MKKRRLSTNRSETLAQELNIVILDGYSTYANALKSFIETVPDVKDIRVFNNIDSASEALERGDFNCLFIDIFSFGVNRGISFVEHVRHTYPIISICLFSQSRNLEQMPGVSKYWKHRFAHYFKLSKDLPIDALEKQLNWVLVLLSNDVQTNVAATRVNNLKTLAHRGTERITKGEKQEIVETVEIVKAALEKRDEKQQVSNFSIPGVSVSQLEGLALKTINETTESLRLATTVNIAVLAIGSIIVVIAFIAAVITNRWEPVAFGAFGIAGVIASLITNPLQSITFRTRRLVQVQAAYLGLLSQLTLLNNSSEKITLIQKSKRLDDSVERTIKSLYEYYGK